MDLHIQSNPALPQILAFLLKPCLAPDLAITVNSLDNAIYLTNQSKRMYIRRSRAPAHPDKKQITRSHH